jgi:hypothetical protein
MAGQRKSIEPMAARLGIDSQRLKQFMADSPWEENALRQVIRREVVPHFELLVMSATAYLFILTTCLAAKRNFWTDVGEDPRSDSAVATEVDRALSLLPLDIPGELCLTKAN